MSERELLSRIYEVIDFNCPEDGRKVCAADYEVAVKVIRDLLKNVEVK